MEQVAGPFRQRSPENPEIGRARAPAFSEGDLRVRGAGRACTPSGQGWPAPDERTAARDRARAGSLPEPERIPDPERRRLLRDGRETPDPEVELGLEARATLIGIG